MMKFFNSATLFINTQSSSWFLMMRTTTLFLLEGTLKVMIQNFSLLLFLKKGLLPTVLRPLYCRDTPWPYLISFFSVYLPLGAVFKKDLVLTGLCTINFHSGIIFF